MLNILYDKCILGSTTPSYQYKLSLSLHILVTSSLVSTEENSTAGK